MFLTLVRTTLTVMTLAILAQAAVLGKDSAGVSAESIKNAVVQSDVLDSEYRQRIYASYENGVASVSLFRHPDATREDCKIDTVLLARRIIALAPHDIKLVRCVFYDFDRQNQFWEVDVRAQLVTAFSQGHLGEHELINSVLLSEDSQKNPLSEKYAALSYSGILNENSVCKGACEDRRLAISLRLKEIEQQGVGPGHFRDDFLRLEDAARRGKAAELPGQISALNKALDDYVQEMIKAGQMQKPELRRAKNTLVSPGKPKSVAAPGL
jgi:hypothetical protein